MTQQKRPLYFKNPRLKYLLVTLSGLLQIHVHEYRLEETEETENKQGLHSVDTVPIDSISSRTKRIGKSF